MALKWHGMGKDDELCRVNSDGDGHGVEANTMDTEARVDGQCACGLDREGTVT